MGFFKDQLIALLYVDDLAANVTFYKDCLGLKELDRWDNGPGERGVKLEVTGGGMIELVDFKPPLPQGPTSLWMEAKDINGLYAALKKNPKVDIFEDISDTYFHARSFQVRDPDGNATFIVAYEKDVQPYTKDSQLGDFFKDEFRTVFFVEDLDACYKFYTETLELPCVYQWDEGPGDRGFKYKAAGSGAYIETLHRIPLLPQGAGTIMIEAHDLDDCFARLKAKKEVKNLTSITETVYGRIFELTDPDDNVIKIFSYRPDWKR